MFILDHDMRKILDEYLPHLYGIVNCVASSDIVSPKEPGMCGPVRSIPTTLRHVLSFQLADHSLCSVIQQLSAPQPAFIVH